MPPSQRSNPLALTVLVLLFEKPMHPYEMAQTLRERHKEESIRLNVGSLYSVVRSLERNGLIRTKETQRQGRRPQRTVYELTNAGRAAMREWLSELLAVPAKEYLQFEAALSLASALPPDEVLDLLRRRIQGLEAIAANWRADLRMALDDLGLPRLFVIEAELQLALVEAERAFTRQLVADIESGELGGVTEWRTFHETGVREWSFGQDVDLDADAADPSDPGPDTP